MAVEVDYYAVINVARDADVETIESAVKKAMREWRKRTEAADLGVRQEAEVKVKQIDDARATLLDANKRAEYDRLLAAGVKETSPPAAGLAPDGVSWIDRAEGYLAVGDYQSAAYAAREATHVEGTNAKTWWIRSRANAGLQLWQDALYEAKQAVQLEESSADYQFNLGLVHEHMNQYQEAVNSYRRAGACDPTNPMYELAVGGVYASTGRPEEALPIVEAVYSKHPHDASANYYLGSILLDLAERIPRKKDRESGTYWVTSRAEIDKMRQFTTRALGLNVVDEEVRDEANRILQYLDKMEQKAWRPPRSLIAGALGAGVDAGCFGFIIMIFLVGALIFLPVILIIAGFGAMGDSPGAGFVMILIGAGLGYLWYRLSYIPRWKHNKKDIG